ncbi:4-oxalocrotonate decarboxylase [Lujinxingia litoralis]|uniref:4-oxalocrotonate decarboxylase n=1 Tax=Lujinxingia litoralis TaxID=2211119 RepID=A0A328C0S5_9DELT|nr:fumarylacetoacetate hydrolase family protein [Lujinxingia litoralis]RAL19993.1 4-oxalocrotonate decarboxylase [Lujinxingia litoralis]
MALSEETIEALAEKVDEAARTTTPLTMLTAELPELTLDEAYTIQRASIARRLERGERLVGMKMGLTSRAKMEQMGVHEPIYGHLTSSMTLSDGATIAHGDYCHPRVEPEIAFIMGADIAGTPTPREALAAVSGVCGALEVIDSRYKDFKFTLIDVVADNASSTGYVLGTRVRPASELDLGNLGMVMSVNGQVVETGSSAAILEHPARSLAALITMLHARGEGLKKGQVVLAGGATKAVALKPGDQVTLEVEGLGRVALGVAG